MRAPPSSAAYSFLRLEVVRVVGEILGTVLRDEDEILESTTAPATAVETGLEGDDIALDELLPDPRQTRLLVDLEADPVPERVEVAVLDDLSGLLVQQRLVAFAMERLARDCEHLGAFRSGLDRGERRVERLLAQPVVPAQLVGHVADAERTRHVREARGLSGLGPE